MPFFYIKNFLKYILQFLNTFLIQDFFFKFLDFFLRKDAVNNNCGSDNCGSMNVH